MQLNSVSIRTLKFLIHTDRSIGDCFVINRSCIIRIDVDEPPTHHNWKDALVSSVRQWPPKCPTVLVAMATFRRPQLLERALSGVVREAALNPLAQVLVVDNDPDGGAAAIVDAWADRGVLYVHEPVPGIAAARNRALQEALRFDALVFIDDDEIPHDYWLRRLVDAWVSWGCAAVTGPVEREFAVEPDRWVTKIGLFDRRRMPSGTQLRSASSNNLLLDMKYVAANDLRFDPAFGLSGGEDTLLTYRISKSGGDIRWCDEAVVSERIPAGRLTHGWVRRRMLRNSNGWARVQIALSANTAGRLSTRMLLALRVLLMTVRAVTRYCYGLLRKDLRKRCQAERDIISATGIALSVIGVVWYEYRRQPQSTV